MVVCNDNFFGSKKMLGTHTKCDLSAGKAKIDLEMLTKQVEIHFYTLINTIRQKTSDIQYNTLKEEDRRKSVSSMSSTGADEIIKLSKQLAETTELLHTLQETENRQIEIV